MNLKELVQQQYETYLEGKSKELGISKEEYLNKLNEEEMERQEKKALERKAKYGDKTDSEIQTIEKLQYEQQIIENVFNQKADEYVKATKTAINKIVKWTTSKHNQMRKAQVVDEIHHIVTLNKTASIQHSFTLYECGTYSNDSARKTASNYGFDQYLLIYNGKARFVYAYNDIDHQVIYEFA